MSSELDVYKLADLLQHKQLKSAVVDNFTYLLNNNWDHASFPAAIEKVYDITPPGKEGDILRKVAVHCVSRLSRHLFQHPHGRPQHPRVREVPGKVSPVQGAADAEELVAAEGRRANGRTGTHGTSGAYRPPM